MAAAIDSTLLHSLPLRTECSADTIKWMSSRIGHSHRCPSIANLSCKAHRNRPWQHMGQMGFSMLSAFLFSSLLQRSLGLDGIAHMFSRFVDASAHLLSFTILPCSCAKLYCRTVLLLLRLHPDLPCFISQAADASTDFELPSPSRFAYVLETVANLWMSLPVAIALQTTPPHYQLTLHGRSTLQQENTSKQGTRSRL